MLDHENEAFKLRFDTSSDHKQGRRQLPMKDLHVGPGQTQDETQYCPL